MSPAARAFTLPGRDGPATRRREAGREKMAKIHANVVEMRQRIADGERLLK